MWRSRNQPLPWLKLLLCAGLVWMGWRVWSGPAGGAEGGLDGGPVLPVVEQRAPEQPTVGLESDTHLDKAPPRQTRGLDLVKLGWSYNCMECHRMLEAKWHHTAPMVEHAEIGLSHGNNRFCLNCHHPTNRNAFVDYDGSEIPEGAVVQLCAKCHGPTYRDWQAGVHGRSNGYWNVNRGPRDRLRCIQCHDPHQPAFQPMPPWAPPTYPARAAYPPLLTGTEGPPAGGGHSP